MSDVSDWARRCADAALRVLEQAPAPPGATYRLQFRPGALSFADAAALVPYLRDLGITHVYASPYLKTRSGSQHGYDIVDHGRLNPELGSAADYDAFVQALRDHGMGHILDFVPNHMGVGTAENAWWFNVLENGPGSPYARYFDIDWKPFASEMENKLLLPILGEQYGQVLESGQLRLEFIDGAFRLRYFDLLLPIEPKSTSRILRLRLDELRTALGADAIALLELESIITELEHLPDVTTVDPAAVTERQREKEVAKLRLQQLAAREPAIARFIQQNVDAFNGTPDDPRSFDRLDELLAAQVYRLSHWKAASDEINYRRFFDINELAAVCMEEEEVFLAAHSFVLDLLARRQIDGLRIDHIDGLFDPTQYLWRLQWGYVAAIGRRCFEDGLANRSVASRDEPEAPSWNDVLPLFFEHMGRVLPGVPPQRVFGNRVEPAAAGAGVTLSRRPAGDLRTPPLYVVVEKILEHDEGLPREWPVAGTTGYDFLNAANGLFIDPRGIRDITRWYERFTKQKQDVASVVYLSKRQILRDAMSSELELLAARMNRLSERHRRFRDFTLNSIRVALREVLACFPVYRTYITGEPVAERDRRIVQAAVAEAKRRNPTLETALLDFVRDTLLLEQPSNLDPAGRQERLVFVGRFQQTSSPVMAKGVEDTAFYRYVPLVCVNEVGAALEHPVTQPADFHDRNRRRCSRGHRGSLLCTTTHDTKRSEDARARLCVLSEIPGPWRRAVVRWTRLNSRYRTKLQGLAAPTRNDEYLFYQSLLAIWPLEPPDEAQHAQLVARLLAYMEKATREAKLHTSWINPQPEYDAAVRYFVEGALRYSPGNRFLNEFRQFHHSVVDWGLYTTLSQVVLKLMSPGVPDLYQGQELWDFSLVDPDNRRDVDFSLRRSALAEIVEQSTRAGRLRDFAEGLSRSPRDPRLKLFVTWKVLQFRRQYPQLALKGDYGGLTTTGRHAAHIVAFWLRLADRPQQPDTEAVVAVPRWLAQLTPGATEGGPASPPLGADVWHDTAIELPHAAPTTWEHILTGEVLQATSSLSAADVFAATPVAVLLRRAD